MPDLINEALLDIAAAELILNRAERQANYLDERRIFTVSDRELVYLSEIGRHVAFLELEMNT